MTKPALRSMLAIVSCLLILVLVNLSISEKEKLLAKGRTVYLELAPVDPRSLMQGDYMALNYRMANEIMQALPRKENPDRPWQPEYKAHGARVVATLNDLFIAQLNRLDDGTALQENEIYLDYRVRGGKLKFASNAFFFQEGTADQYETAHHGRFKVAVDGELLLVALHDEQLKQLGIETR
jgi:uncharacterized membrane-anchored protein